MSHEAIEFTQEFWDNRYSSAGRLWSGQPNALFAAHAADLEPGEALDAGCGEGADAIWLARRGWAVTAVDVSAVALERAAAAAGAAGGDVAGRIGWRREDLLTWVPEPDRYDLVSAQFMHFPRAELTAFHQRLATAVRPGGTLLLIAHHPDDLHAARNGHPDRFWYAEDIAASLEPGQWEVRVAEASGRSAIDHDGQPVTVRDTVLRAARRR
ncbi:MAG TPA: class I SAM-dependent methyltransferase [Streptosporangiaceae bacterium]|nr:class I SAM-dependent methyltransferase [Streptosporangiaceae bacterium]